MSATDSARPESPGRPSQSSTGTTTTPASRAGSRPSFVIPYTQPPPSTASSSFVKSPVVPEKPTSDPLPSSAASSSIRPPATQGIKHFVAPAHPQSHHLHSLPPREKTTRTLILDHTAWQHTRTRFAQARCELGMRVHLKRKGQMTRPPGDDSFYISTARPGGTPAVGNVPEVELASSEDEGEDEEGRESDDEIIRALNYGMRKSRDAKVRTSPGRENSEKSMDVNNRESAAVSGEEVTPDASLAPVLAARASGIEKVLNAMLAQPSSPPPRSPSPTPYALHSSHAHSQHYRAPPSVSARTPRTQPRRRLPNGVRLRLALLALVDDLFERQPIPASDEQLAKSSEPSSRRGSSPISPTLLPPPSVPSASAFSPALTALAQISSQSLQTSSTLSSLHSLTLPSSSNGQSYQTSSSLRAGSMDASKPAPPLFTWARPSGSSSPTQSVSDTEQLSSPGAPTSSPRAFPTSWDGSIRSYHHLAASLSTRRAVGRSRELYAAGCRRVVGKTACPRHLVQQCNICRWNGSEPEPASRIGAGLLRKTRSSGMLADMVPRFLRLSALVAMELGREARGEEAGADVEGEGGGSVAGSAAASSTVGAPAHPTRAWYALLCGLLTRAVLEGYVGRGWRGGECAEVLMGVGVKLGRGGRAVEEGEEFEPDEMPGLVEAGAVLFGADESPDEAAMEYVSEMEARLSEMLSVAPSTPDLSTHLTALSSQYPAVPVERAALRFCEAVAQWRGRPELATYKSNARASTPGALPIHALLAPPKPAIERYFRAAPGSVAGMGVRGLKRAREDGEGEDGDGDDGEGERVRKKRVVVEQDLGDEWVGPYGV